MFVDIRVCFYTNVMFDIVKMENGKLEMGHMSKRQQPAQR